MTGKERPGDISKKKQKEEKTKNGTERFRFFVFLKMLSAFHFVAFEATCAHVCGFHLAVFDDLHLLDVRFESSSRFAVAVAHVVAGILPLVANAANPRHINTSTVII